MVFIKINAVIFLGGEEGGNGESRIYWRHVSFEIGIGYEGGGAERQAVGYAVFILGSVGARDVNLGILSVKVQGRKH